MRYTHGLHIIRHRKHTIKISLIITGLLLILIVFLGFSILDAKMFFGGLAASFIRVIIAYIVALFLSVSIILLIGSSPAIENIAIPLLDALQSFPAFSLFPLLIVWLGKTSIVTIIILVIEMIWPLLFTIHSGKKTIRNDLLEAATIFEAKGFKFFTYVLFPLLLPSIITGSIVAWGEAWETVIAAEIIVAVPGVGTYLTESANSNHTQVLVIGILLLLMILFILNKYIWLSLLNTSTKYQQE